MVRKNPGRRGGYRTSQNVHFCAPCNYYFQNDGLLRGHIASGHLYEESSAPKIHVCKACDCAFGHMAALGTHKTLCVNQNRAQPATVASRSLLWGNVLRAATARRATKESHKSTPSTWSTIHTPTTNSPIYTPATSSTIHTPATSSVYSADTNINNISTSNTVSYGNSLSFTSCRGDLPTLDTYPSSDDESDEEPAEGTTIPRQNIRGIKDLQYSLMPTGKDAGLHDNHASVPTPGGFVGDANTNDWGTYNNLNTPSVGNFSGGNGLVYTGLEYGNLYTIPVGLDYGIINTPYGTVYGTPYYYNSGAPNNPLLAYMQPPGQNPPRVVNNPLGSFTYPAPGQSSSHSFSTNERYHTPKPKPKFDARQMAKDSNPPKPSGKRKNKYGKRPCPLCSKEFKTESSLKMHLASQVHTPQPATKKKTPEVGNSSSRGNPQVANIASPKTPQKTRPGFQREEPDSHPWG